MDKVTTQSPQTTTFLKRKETRSGIEPRSFRLPMVDGLTARPNRLTPCVSKMYSFYSRCLNRIEPVFMRSCTHGMSLSVAMASLSETDK